MTDTPIATRLIAVAVQIVGITCGIAFATLGALLLAFSHSDYLWIGAGSLLMLAAVLVTVLFVAIGDLLRGVAEIRKKLK